MITTVDGLERHPHLRSGQLDTSVDLIRCRCCGSVAGYRSDRGYLRAECANTSCGIATPYHYMTREDAAYAWNRKPGDPAKRTPAPCYPALGEDHPALRKVSESVKPLDGRLTIEPG